MAFSGGAGAARERRSRALAIAAISAAYAHNLWMSWLKWGDVVVDCGRDLDVARQLVEGRTLYLDVRYYFGPLAPWINAVLMKCWGFHAGALMFGGLLCAALTCVVIYRLARRFTSRPASVMVTVLFLYACAFGHLSLNGIFNFVLPYTQSATYGMAACLASVLFLVRHAQEGRRVDFLASLFFLALSALTKIELLFAVGIAHAVFVAGQWWCGRLHLRRTALGYAAVAAAVGVVYGALVARAGSAVFTDNLLVQVNPDVRHFTLSNLGLLDWPRSLAEMAFSALALLAVTALGRAGVPALGLLAGFLVYVNLPIEFPFRVMPALALGVLGIMIRRSWRDAPQRAELLPHAILWSFALASLSRMLLKTVPYQYGFYLLPPALIALGVFVFEYAPRAFALGAPVRRAAAFGAVGIFAGLTAAHARASKVVYDARTRLIDTPYARLYIVDKLGEAPVGLWYAETIRRLSRLPRQARVLVIPQGIGLTFCAGLVNRYGTGGMTASEVSGRYDDPHLLARLKALPPDVIVRIDLPEVGGQHFGRNYAIETWNWIREAYEPFTSLGAGPAANFIVFMKRKGAPPPFPA